MVLPDRAQALATGFVILYGGSEMSSVRLIRSKDRKREVIPTPGMTREEAFSDSAMWSGFVRTAAGMTSGWHHHGDYASLIYVASGEIRMESGAGGKEIVDAKPGDFVFVPKHMIHRESNPSNEESGLVVVRVGSGSPVTNRGWTDKGVIESARWLLRCDALRVLPVRKPRGVVHSLRARNQVGLAQDPADKQHNIRCSTISGEDKMSRKLTSKRCSLEQTNLFQESIKNIKKLSSKSISEDLKIDIKDYFGYLRSVLDYLSHEVVDKCCPMAKKNDKLYFPICQDSVSFVKAMKKSYPELETNCKAVYDIFESVQPFKKVENKWLTDFNKLNNENKHDRLVAQTRSESKRVIVEIKGGGSVSWDPNSVKFGTEVSIGGVPVNPQTQMPNPSSSQTVKVETWVDFQFEDINDSAIC
jgi:uncharacterized RmlC-like cupin family protein